MAQPLPEPRLHEVALTVHHTQITPPQPCPLRRPALVRKIGEAARGRLTLILAPAGWGKSSALAEWAAVTTTDVAWLTCGEGDREPGRLARGLASAIDRVRPGTGADVLALAKSSRVVPVEELLLALMDALSDDTDPLIIVIDQFEHIDDTPVLAALQRAIAAAPSHVHVVIASRTVPPWSLGRWRASGDVAELGVADLAFSEQETASLVHGLASDSALRSLHARSEGWAAGVRLAALWLERNGSSDDIAACFRGTHRDVADYLSEEVFAGLPGDVQEFLLTTSMLEELSASLCQAVTGHVDAAAMLERIEAQGLFLIPMDTERRSYRYHALFRDFLQDRLLRAMPEAKHDILCRAATWYEADGDHARAAEHLLHGGNLTRAAALLEQSAEQILMELGEPHTFIHLAGKVPPELRRTHPQLQRCYAWALALTGRLEDAEAALREIEADLETLQEDARRSRQAEIAGIRARLAAYGADHSTTIRFAEDALARATAEQHVLRADALLSLGFAHRATGKIEEAARDFAEASALGWRFRIAHAACWGSRYRAVTLVSQGRLEEATLLVEEDLDRARQVGMDRGAARAALLVGRGELRYERNDLAGARRDLEQALALARQAGDAKILMNGYLACALLEEAEGDPSEARRSVQRAIRVFNGPMEKAYDAWLALRRGDLDTVRRWAAWYRQVEGEAPSLSCGEIEQVMYGRALLALGRSEQGSAFLGALLEEAEATGRHGRAMTIRLLLALHAEEAGRDEMELLGPVIDLAARERYVRTILDEGPEALALLRRVARTDASATRRQYVAALLTSATSGDMKEPATTATGLIEPLTERQREILQLLADGRSNREIAEALFVSEGTVKAHVHQIFGKLLVRTRTEAIRTARDLRLLA